MRTSPPTSSRRRSAEAAAKPFAKDAAIEATATIAMARKARVRNMASI
jgi:hypothetical protein